LLTRDEARRIAANIAKLPKAAVVAGQLLDAPVSRSFAGFRWCTAQTVALYFTLSGAGNFRLGSAGLDSSKGNLRARFPGRVLIIVSVQGCRPAPFRNNRHKVGDLASSLTLSQAIPEPPLPAPWAAFPRGAWRC
jgi:hypothetical protein